MSIKPRVQNCGSGFTHRECPEAGVNNAMDGRVCNATPSKHAICSYSAWIQPTSIIMAHDISNSFRAAAIPTRRS